MSNKSNNIRSVMKSQKTILHRVVALYIIFFVVIAISLVRTFSRFSGEAFNTGRNDVWRMLYENHDRKVDLLYDLPTATSIIDFDMPLSADSCNVVTVNARPSRLDVQVTYPIDDSDHTLSLHSYSIALGLLATAIYFAVFVILFIILGSLRKSIRSNDVFSRRNIALTRTIALLLIIASLMFSLVAWMEIRSVADLLAQTNFPLNKAFPFDFGEIIMGVLIFVIAEIFSIGSSLSEEQNLTI